MTLPTLEWAGNREHLAERLTNGQPQCAELLAGYIGKHSSASLGASAAHSSLTVPCHHKFHWIPKQAAVIRAQI